jgi:pimeloyl-ACP methyl ester carboxylesterase
MPFVLPAYRAGALVTPDGARIPYVMLGDGPTALTIIPGAGDGLRTVTEAAAQLAWYFRRRARHYRVLILSRRQPIPVGYRAEAFADDSIWAMEQLAWGPAILECNSGGGPIGQWIAVKRPDLARGLIVSVTFHHTDDHLRAVLQHWIALAQQGRWAEFQWSSIERTFRPQTVARYRLMRPLLRLIAKPRHPERVVRVLESLLEVDNQAILPRIACPALVIGGVDDRVINAELQREMAALLPNSRLLLYPGYGHSNDQENPDYEVQVARFAEEVMRTRSVDRALSGSSTST